AAPGPAVGAVLRTVRRRSRRMAAMNLPRVHLSIDGHFLEALVARTEEERATGLMYRRDMGEDEGMLFMGEDPAVQRFWMKDTPLPLSIAFIGEDGTILRLADLEPHSLDGESS